MSCINNVVFKDFACGSYLLALIDIEGNMYIYNDLDKLVKIKTFSNVKQCFFSQNNLFCVCENNRIYMLNIRDDKYIDYESLTFKIYKINKEVDLKILDIPFYNNLLFFEAGILT